MTPLALALLAACGTSAELGAPNDPPEWPMGTDLHPPPQPPAPPVAPADTDVAAGPEASAAPAAEVTEPPAPTPLEPVASEPPEGH